jgi:predicted DCC family thiol-disulfide oxidoreductase YuxK
MQIVKIYYNQSCSICNSEINFYKNRIKNPLFEWVNIHDNLKANIETKKTKDQLMRRMHASVNGHLVVGAKVFLIIWEEIENFKILAKIFSNPILYPLFFLIYEIVALPLYLKAKYFN